MFDKLTKSSGFPTAIRSLGFVALAAALLSIPALLSGSSMLAAPRKARALFDRSALHDKLFLNFTACTFAIFLGYIVPYFYIPTYARERLGCSDSLALYMLVFAIAGSFFGRLLSGVLAHYLGAIVTWMLCTFCSGILALSWISIEKESEFIAFSVLWGFFSAALVTVPSAAFANITPDLSRLGTRLGMSWSVSSIASLIGAPIAGALLRKREDGSTDFLGVQIWSGVCLMVGTGWLGMLYIVTVRAQKKGWRV
jgi:predicted MFS family arabinose efflux permease